MPEEAVIPAGFWWTCGRYEIRNGRIRPVKGAEPKKYNPWTARKPEEEALYEPLVRIGKLVLTNHDKDEDKAKAKAEVERESLRFCERYGPLGLLTHLVVMMRLKPRRVREKPFGEMSGHQELDRTPTGWTTRDSIPLDPDEFKRPVAICRVGNRLRITGVDGIRARFFPAIRSRSKLPLPLSKRFCQEYSEPFTDFRHMAVLFFKAMDDIRGRNVDAGLKALDEFVRGVQPIIVPDRKDTFRQRWVFGSLIEAIALMAILDITRGRTPRQCPCGAIFFSSAYQVRYCSPTCRYRLKKGRQRSRMRAKAKRKKNPSPKRPR